MSKKNNATVEQPDVNETTGQADETTTAETEQEQTTGETTGTEQAEAAKLIYVGPSIAFSKLRSSMILEGTVEEIHSYLAEYEESYPEIKYLLVTPEQLTDALDKVARKGTILHKYYEDTLAKVRANRR